MVLIVLQPFIQDLNRLSTEGIQVTVNGCPRLFKGALLVFWQIILLVMQLEVSSFHFPCQLITSSNHLHYCDLIEAEEPLHSHYSTTYGINYRTCLLDVKHYSLFGGLLHNMMHGVLEGTAPLEIKLLIAHCIIIQVL